MRASAGGIPQTTPAQARAALENARSEALPHWRKLIEQYPRSPRLPQALYHAGVLHTEGAKPDAERSAAAFEQLTKQFPASPWAGDAHVRLIDVKLERQFDLPAAALHARAATDWLETIDPEAIARAQRALGAPPSASPLPLAGEGPGVRASADGIRQSAAEPGAAAALPPLRRTRYDIYLRAGLVAYLSERPTEAVEWFERAKPFEPERGFVVVHGEIPTGIERLIAAARSGKSLTPEEARRGDERARLILMLADVYVEGQQWEKSLELCTEVIEGAARQATREQKSYAHFRRARNYYSLDGRDCNPEAALRDYVAAVYSGPKAPWASKAMFLAGNIQWNHKRDGKSAISIWTRIMREYPDSDDADTAAMFTAVVYRWTDRPEQARQVLTDFLARRPDSRLAEGARKQLLKLDLKQERPR